MTYKFLQNFNYKIEENIGKSERNVDPFIQDPTIKRVT